MSKWAVIAQEKMPEGFDPKAVKLVNAQLKAVHETMKGLISNLSLSDTRCVTFFLFPLIEWWPAGSLTLSFVCCCFHVP